MLKTLLLAVVALATPAVAAHRDTPDVEMQKALAGRVPGKPTDCISMSGSNSSQIIDGRAIIYKVGSRLYVNEPAQVLKPFGTTTYW